MRFLLQFITSVLVTFGALVGLAYLKNDLKELLKSRRSPSSYRQNGSLFSVAERSFFGVLEELFGEDYRVFGKVRVADLIQPEKGAGGRSALNRIAGKHVDFVVCEANDLSVIGVIELDVGSHRQDSRPKRDISVDGAFASAGIPIIHFPVQAAYNLSSIRDAIRQTFSLNIPEPGKPVTAKPSGSLKIVSLCDFRDLKRSSLPER